MMFGRKILKFLEDWLKRSSRKPLILRGARQVGKTCAVRIFAAKHFDSFIELNLENPEHERLFREPLSLIDFERILEIKFGKKIEGGKTLLFIDEIQNSIPLMKLLRFFYEERPNLPVIAAGSLLEVKLQKKNFSFPVGRVEYAYLHPMDYFEYLQAISETTLLETLQNAVPEKPLPAAVHEIAQKTFNEYLMVGGMPEAVKVSIETKDFNAVNRVYNSLFTSFIDDVHKYSSDAKVKYLLHVIENAPLFAGQTITYEHFANSLYRSREMSEAFEILEKAMLLYRVMGSKEKKLPLLPKKKKAPKIIFLDTGLVNYRLGLREKIMGLKNLNEFYQGKIAEQITAQHLLARGADYHPQLFYWYRDVPGSTAEVDFVIAHKGEILPIEVKSGSSGRLRSLMEFMKNTGGKIALRIYHGQLTEEKINADGVKFRLISVPFYLLPKALELT